ncbi:MAG: glycoside hydrolase family 88 protein [Phycisphaeraceae bacterium]
MPTVHHAVADLVVPPPTTPPADKRVPFGWRAFAVCGPGRPPAQLQWWGVIHPHHEAARLRLTVAIDERQVRRVDVALARSRRRLGRIEMRYAYPLQPFELELPAQAVGEVLREGLTLTLADAGEPLWLIAEQARRGPGHELLMPHFMWPGRPEPSVGERQRQLLDRLASLASVQPFGWIEGCVLDALADLAGGDADPGPLPREAARAALDQHLDLYFPVVDEPRVVYEDMFSRPADDHLHGIEQALMFAPLARVRPQHPMLDKALDHLQRMRRPDGAIYGGPTITCEGAYTVAWPLSLIARQRGDADLAALALAQLRHRRDRLVHDGGVWLRHSDDGTRTYRNWARGVAWYALGLVRTLELFDEPACPADLVAEARRLTAWVRGLQRDDGLWDCFLDEPATGRETSGSAGIATALARAAGAGLADDADAARAAAERTLTGLGQWLTPDGLLGGVSQSNKAEAGEAGQRSGHRVISQMGMGLAGQLMAALS